MRVCVNPFLSSISRERKITQNQRFVHSRLPNALPTPLVPLTDARRPFCASSFQEHCTYGSRLSQRNQPASHLPGAARGNDQRSDGLGDRAQSPCYVTNKESRELIHSHKRYLLYKYDSVAAAQSYTRTACQGNIPPEPRQALIPSPTLATGQSHH